MKINKNIMCTVLSFGLIASLGSGMAVKAEGEYQTTGEDYEINYIAISETDGTTKAFLDVVKMYQEQVNPNFKMNMEYINDQQARNQKIRTLAASDELPDWFTCDIDSFYEQLWDAGVVANVGEIYDELGITDKFYPTALHYPSLESGEIVGISWQSKSEFFYYNKDVFAEAGIEETPKTFDELLDACAKIESIQKTPIAMDGAWRLLRYLAFVPYRMNS